VSRSGTKIYWEDSELKTLAVDLTSAPLRMQFAAPKRLREAARVVEREMRVDAEGHIGNYFGKPGTEYPIPLAQHVSSELLSDYEAEIGIEARGAGKLAHIIAYGSVNNAPAYDPGAGPRRAMPRVLEIFADLAEKAVLGEERQ
jgi:beta-glucosidase-like glycosyl hydrolase